MALKTGGYIFCSILISLSSWGGNGSSGVGTAGVMEGFGTENAENLVVTVNDTILDKTTQEKIIKVTKIQKEEINFSQLSPSILGRVKGYEYIPNIKGRDNYWVVCKTDKNICYKLGPLSKTNKKVMSIIGSLFEKI